MDANRGLSRYQLVNEWRTWQYAASLSRRTVEERTATVVRFANWTAVPPESATSSDIAEWLAEGGTWAKNTRWTYFTTLTAWFTWLQLMDYRIDNPMVKMKHPKRSKGVPRPVSNHDVQRLLVVRARRRTRAMLILATFAGLRAHEIAKVKGEHFDLVLRTLTVTGKGDFTDTLPLHHRVVEIAYQMPRRGYWFPGSDHGHQRRESVSQTIKEAMVRANVIGSAHQLRHWYGTALLEAGVDVRVVQTLMRHQNISSTQIYTKVSERLRFDGIDRLDPFQMEPMVRVTPELHTAAFGQEFDVDESSVA